MRINKNFNNMTDQEKWDFVHALESFKDIQGNTLTIKEEIRQLQNQISDLRFIIKKDGE